MKHSDLLQFFEQNPSIDIEKFAMECGISLFIFLKIISGEKPLFLKEINKIKPVIIKYGWLMSKREILEKHWKDFRLSTGLQYEPMSDKAYECFESAMEEYFEYKSSEVGALIELNNKDDIRLGTQLNKYQNRKGNISSFFHIKQMLNEIDMVVMKKSNPKTNKVEE